MTALFIVCAVAALTPFFVRAQLPSTTILLVIDDAATPLGRYLAEVLRSEGLTDISTVAVSSIDGSTLNSARLVIVAPTPLTAAQAALIRDYVAGGGRLVAMRPDDQLAVPLGITPVGGSTSNGYVSVSQTSVSGAGFPTETLPYFGQANHYGTLNGAVPVATLYSDRTTATAYPAVIRFGRTATWAFDLATSVVYARQGNPANAGVERDGLVPVRTNDVFYGAIDLERVHIPHADYHMRLFSTVIADLLADEVPLPRVWYFPNGARTLLVPTADSHANPAAYFDDLIAGVEARGARISLYIAGGIYPDATTAAAWRARGHEVGLHPGDYPTPLSTAYETNLSYFATHGLGAPSRTVRNHLVEWQGWTDAAEVALGAGIGLDVSFYTWGPGMAYPDGRQAHGYINGSGLPMRFITQSGAILPIYQQVTSLIDEQLLVGTQSEQLTAAEAIAVSRTLIDASQAGHYSAVATQFHVDYYAFTEVRPWVQKTLDYAVSLGIPIWTAERWLAYTEARSATRLRNLDWLPGARVLRFSATVPAGSEPQTVALPATYANRALSGVAIDGSPAATTQQTIYGRLTRFLSMPAGLHSVEVAYDGAIASANHAPTAVADAAVTPQDVPVIVPVLANDSDPDGDPLTIAAITQGAIGAVAVNPDGKVTYTPSPAACGPDAFSYTASDGRGGSAGANVTINITCPNLPPNAVDDSIGTNAGVPVVISVLANDTDPNGDTLTVTAVGQPANGTAALNSGTTVTYTPAAGYCGADNFTYTVSDPDGATDLGAVSVTIACLPPPDQPATVTLQVRSGADDANEVGGIVTSGEPSIWVGNGGATTGSYTGLRFTNVDIARGARVTAARLEVYSAQNQWISLNIEIAAHDVGDSGPISATSGLSSRVLTTERVTHTSDVNWPVNTWQSLGDIASVLNAIVNRTDWAPGNDVTIVLRGTAGAWNRKFVTAVETSPTLAPRLIVTYGVTNEPPVITSAAASPTGGPAPLTVNFTGAATDADGDSLAYTWTFGDGTTAPGAAVAHVYSTTGRYTATLAVSDGPHQVVSQPIVIQVGAPPEAVITSAGPSPFQAGQTIAYSGSATDADEALGPGAFSWTILLHHDSHTHLLQGPVTGSSSGAYQVPTTAAALGGHDFSGVARIEIRLTVTDSGGLQDTTSAFVDAQKVNLNVSTTPAGLSVGVDGALRTAPFALDTLVGFQHTLAAAATQALGGFTYDFQSWSDGGAATHTVTAPASAASYAATYVLRQGPATATFQVSAGGDDVSEADTTFEPNASPFWVGNGGTTTLSFTGVRLTNVSIPAGATVQSAQLQFYSTQLQWIGLGLSVAADATGNSAPFSAVSRPSQRALTAQTMTHTSDTQWLENTWYTLLDLAPVIQEVVNRADWVPGNSISVLIRGTASAYSRKFVSSFEQNAGFAPRLVITYAASNP